MYSYLCGPPPCAQTDKARAPALPAGAKNARTSRERELLRLEALSPLDYVKRHAGRVVYRLLCNEQMNFLTVSSR